MEIAVFALLHGREDRSGERVPERAERFKEALDAPGIVDAATDSPNAPERGGRWRERRRGKTSGGCLFQVLFTLVWNFEWWLPGPDSKN